MTSQLWRLIATVVRFDEIKVDEVLNIVVFGESLLNDGVAVVLYHMFESFCKLGLDNVGGSEVGLGIASFGVVAGGGVLIGITIGYLCAFVTRWTPTPDTWSNTAIGHDISIQNIYLFPAGS